MARGAHGPAVRQVRCTVLTGGRKYWRPANSMRVAPCGVAAAEAVDGSVLAHACPRCRSTCTVRPCLLLLKGGAAGLAQHKSLK